MIGKYIFNILIAFDVLVNTIFGGSPKQTMSSRVMLYKDTNWCANLVYKFLDKIDYNHCEDALEYDKKGVNPDDAILK